jgi:uncharacterized YigZ family protein
MIMRYLKEKSTYTYDVNKSQFIAILYPLQHQHDIKTFIEEAKNLYPKADHYCSASLYGDDQEQQTADDDGEPSRTAGLPILDVLKHHDVTNILCVVIRYFGGIKLGAGGLVRAYSHAAAGVMKTSSFYIKKWVKAYRIRFDYTHVDKIDHYLCEKATIIDKGYTEIVTYHIALLPDISNIDDIVYLLKTIEPLEDQLRYLDA